MFKVTDLNYQYINYAVWGRIFTVRVRLGLVRFVQRGWVNVVWGRSWRGNQVKQGRSRRVTKYMGKSRRVTKYTGKSRLVTKYTGKSGFLTHFTGKPRLLNQVCR